jgi:hypothetical protein
VVKGYAGRVDMLGWIAIGASIPKRIGLVDVSNALAKGKWTYITRSKIRKGVHCQVLCGQRSIKISIDVSQLSRRAKQQGCLSRLLVTPANDPTKFSLTRPCDLTFCFRAYLFAASKLCRTIANLLFILLSGDLRSIISYRVDSLLFEAPGQRAR